MTFSIKKSPHLPASLVVIVGSVLFGCLPIFYFYSVFGIWLPKIMPQLSSDSLYYLTQAREVLDGHASLGNPFIKEYADAWFPGLLLPIWIVALPGFLGFGINDIFVFNKIFWHVCTSLVLFVLFLRITKNDTWLSAGISLFGLLSLHNLIIRPILQVVYPALALFLLALLGVLEKPRSKTWHAILGFSAAFAFYLYPYLWMAEFAALGLLVLYRIWCKDWAATKMMLFVWVGVVLLCIPQVFTVASLFSDEMSKTIGERSGLVESHRVFLLTITNLKYIIAIPLVFGFLRIWRKWSASEAMLLFIACGILLSAFSNVITGKFLDLDTHPLWMAFLIHFVAIPVLATSLIHRWKAPLWERALLVLMLFAFVFTTTARTWRNALPYIMPRNIEVELSSQDYVRVLSFLQQAGADESVVMAPVEIGQSVVLYSNNYLLYFPATVLHVIPDEEILERWLLQNVDRADASFVEQGVANVAGYKVIQQTRFKKAQGEEVKWVDIVGGEAFVNRALALREEIAKNYSAYLAKYHTEYIVTDTLAPDNPRVPNEAEKMYSDDRFTIYKFTGL